MLKGKIEGKVCRIFVILRKIIFLGFFVAVRRKLREFFFLCVCCQRISDSDDDCLFLRIFFWGCLVFEEGKLRERECVCVKERGKGCGGSAMVMTFWF